MSLLRRVRRALPHGATLPADMWRSRHRALVALLWGHVIGIPLFALAAGYDGWHAAFEGALVLPFAVAGMLLTRWRSAAVTIVAIGLVTCSAIVVHVSGGYVEAHFHFFVVIVLLTLYEDWVPFLVAFGYVLLHHGLAGGLAPYTVFNHQEAYDDPWKWAAIHAGFIGASGLASIVNWRLNEETRTKQLAHERDYREQLERLNAELRSMDELKSSFLAMASHELRTPLTSIRGFSSTMLDRWDDIGSEEKRTYLGIVDDQAERLTRLVDDLLVLSRIESGTVRTRPESVRIAAVLERTIRNLGLEGVQVECHPELEAVADPDHLVQILVNYLGNAIKYGAGPLELRADRRDDCVEVWVCDHGPGVPAEFVDHLFERFSQGPNTAGYSSTGLGLSIVRGLAEAQGGRAWYEPGEGGGSCFAFSLPAA